MISGGYIDIAYWKGLSAFCMGAFNSLYTSWSCVDLVLQASFECKVLKTSDQAFMYMLIVIKIYFNNDNKITIKLVEYQQWKGFQRMNFVNIYDAWY